MHLLLDEFKILMMHNMDSLYFMFNYELHRHIYKLLRDMHDIIVSQYLKFFHN